MNQYDFIAVGDITTDAFIRIKDATVHCDINREHCTLSVRFGDKIPYEFVEVVPAVGNSPNAAVSASRLGLKTALVSNLGDDTNASECIETLAKEKVATEFLTKHSGLKTNYHYVLWYEDERTILIKHEEYPYTLPDIGDPRFLYLSSLGQNSLPFHQSLSAYLTAHPNIFLVFQPGTFQIKFGYETLRDIYQKTSIFSSNKEEAQKILGLEQEQDVKRLLQEMRERGPRIVVITDSTRGAYAFDGTDMWFMPPYPDPKPPFERTGAGDAFSSTFAAALALGKTVPEALSWAPINSMSVVQAIGAQRGLLSQEALERYLSAKPDGYAPQKL